MLDPTGIDLHANNTIIVAINDNSEVVREAKLPTSPPEWTSFLAAFWYWPADWCNDNNIQLTLAHSKMVKAISYTKVKTDKVDAKTLAEVLRAGLIPEGHQASRERRELRELTRSRLRLIQWRSKLQSTLWGLAYAQQR